MAERDGPHWVRVLKSGSIYEVYRYSKPVCWGYSSRGGRKVGHSEGLGRAKVLGRMRAQIRRLALANFDNRSRFVTLTFARNVTDLDEANGEFKRFIQRMRYRFGEFRYMAVIEFQKRGAVHYHVMTDWPFVRQSELGQIWGQGYVKVNRIDRVDNVGAYMVKYMTKDLSDDRLKGRKAYLLSKGLNHPRLYRGVEARAVLKALEGKEVVFSRRYTTEYQGNTVYEEYNLRRVSQANVGVESEA